MRYIRFMLTALFAFLTPMLAPAAPPTNTYLSYDHVGDREDLTDIISNISPEKTPLYSMIGRFSVSNTLFEWQTDSLEAASTTNAQLEGNDASFTAVTPTTRLGNYVQISSKTLVVSDTQEKVKKAGRKSEIAYQLQKDAVELRRDIEATILNNQGADAGALATARKTGTLLAFLKTNTDFEGTGTDPVYTSIPTDPRNDGATRALTETMVKTVIQACWTAGGEPTVILVNATQKTAISAFSGIATKTYNINNPKPGAIVAAADVYVSDFGTFKVMPDRFMRSRDLLLIDTDYIDIGFLRGFQQIPLARTGDAEKRLLLAEWGLRVKNEAALGGVFDLS